ncbi:hypothetical protein ANO11243_077850 [Dothideomycetidae sp. 11243]|nr:hypothetical protein ANO11243_077850 [fungal sp. No.11243]
MSVISDSDGSWLSDASQSEDCDPQAWTMIELREYGGPPGTPVFQPTLTPLSHSDQSAFFLAHDEEPMTAPEDRSAVHDPSVRLAGAMASLSVETGYGAGAGNQDASSATSSGCGEFLYDEGPDSEESAKGHPFFSNLSFDIEMGGTGTALRSNCNFTSSRGKGSKPQMVTRRFDVHGGPVPIVYGGPNLDEPIGQGEHSPIWEPQDSRFSSLDPSTIDPRFYHGHRRSQAQAVLPSFRLEEPFRLSENDDEEKIEEEAPYPYDCGEEVAPYVPGPQLPKIVMPIRQRFPEPKEEEDEEEGLCQFTPDLLRKRAPRDFPARNELLADLRDAVLSWLMTAQESFTIGSLALGYGEPKLLVPKIDIVTQNLDDIVSELPPSTTVRDQMVRLFVDDALAQFDAYVRDEMFYDPSRPIGDLEARYVLGAWKMVVAGPSTREDFVTALQLQRLANNLYHRIWP